MTKEYEAFSYKMRHNLRYRLMTAILVFVLPVCILGGILLGIIGIREERETHAIEQARLEDAMEYWQEDTATIDGAMEYFSLLLSDELNSEEDGQAVSDRVFAQLSNILPAVHNGLFAFRDNRSGSVLVRMNDSFIDPSAVPGQISGFSAAAAGEGLTDAGWVEIDGRYYLLRRFDYPSCSVFFGLEVCDSLLERTAAIRRDNARLYAIVGERMLELTADGPSEISLDWDSVTAGSLRRTAVSWSADDLPICVCIVENRTIWERVPAGYWILFVLFLVSFAITANVWRIIQLEVLDPAQKLSDAMRQIQNGNLRYRLEDTFYRNSDEMQYLFDVFDEMADEVEASRDKDQKMHQAEMDSLRLQVNPHMLLNSLNAIYSLAQTRKYEAIQEYSLHLVDYFRYVLRHNDDFVTLQQELDFIETYVDIQKIRYPGALSFVYTVDDECRNARVPPLLIQNFIENAAKYAVTPGKVTEILLDVQRLDDRLMIAVTDTGHGIKPEVLDALQTGEPYVDALGQKHIGIWNCRRRIEVFYRESPRLEIFSADGKTQVAIDIPYLTEV